MPKVSQEHLERRRQQILDAARECFRKQGFHNTSMQDIFKASGLSAGAVYRYFPSKHQLVRAIALGSLDQALERLDMAGALAQAASAGVAAPGGADAPGGAGTYSGAPLREMADIVTALGGVFAGTRPIVIQVWAEASLDPEMATIARDVLSQLIERIEGLLPPGVPPEVARLLMATVQGFLVQSLIFEDVTDDLIATTSRAAFR